jgi:CheY-like chemotaxis protein
MTKPLRLLVIEDTEEYTEIAKTVFEEYGAERKLNLDVQYVATYTDAITALESGEVDAVISDLFFPFAQEKGSSLMHRLTELVGYKTQAQKKEEVARESTTWVDIAIPQIVKELDEIEKRLDPKCRFYRTDKDHYDSVRIGLGILQEDKYAVGTQGVFPHGLGIAEYCEAKKIPFVIVSQGERHGGDLAHIRAAYMHRTIREGEEGDMAQLLLYDGAAPSMMDYGQTISDGFRSERSTDKSYKQTWVDAVSHKTSGLYETIQEHVEHTLNE